MLELRTTLALIKAHTKYPNQQLLAYFDQAEAQIRAIEDKNRLLTEIKQEIIDAVTGIKRGKYKPKRLKTKRS